MAHQPGISAKKRSRALPTAVVICVGVAFAVSRAGEAFAGTFQRLQLRNSIPNYGRMRGMTPTLRLAQESEVKEEIRWLDPLDEKAEEITPAEDATVLPVFPLGGPFMPYTKQSLQIFEPRYRQLYDNILLSGSRRFVVCPVDPRSEDSLRLGEVGVVFYLDDLKDLSEQTQDRVKYVCEHSVIGRVKLKRVLNPADWFSRSTYLRAETDPVEDTDTDVDSSLLEQEVMQLMRDLVPLYGELGQPTYDVSLLERRNSSRAEEGGLWSLGEVWVQLLGAQLQTKRKLFEGRLQDILRSYAKSGQTELRITDLPPEALADIKRLEQEFQAMGNKMVMQQLEFGQLLIQTDSHRGRLEQFKSALDEEYRKLIAQKSLKHLTHPSGTVGKDCGAEQAFKGPQIAVAVMRQEIERQQVDVSPSRRHGATSSHFRKGSPRRHGAATSANWRASGSPRRSGRSPSKRAGYGGQFGTGGYATGYSPTPSKTLQGVGYDEPVDLTGDIDGGLHCCFLEVANLHRSLVKHDFCAVD
ncbi:unnamed protein product [Symbiodinium sp. CCMP2592]|nr:unnamed protein product [Symbiodinium sp. CCMP2592]